MDKSEKEESVEYCGQSSLVNELDNTLIPHDFPARVLVICTDGKHIVGTLRSYDQYGSVVLEDCRQRFMTQTQKAELPLGLYIIRGTEIVLIGAIDEEKEAAQELTTVPMPEIQAAIKAEEEAAIAKGETPYAASWKMRMSI